MLGRQFADDEVFRSIVRFSPFGERRNSPVNENTLKEFLAFKDLQKFQNTLYTFDLEK